MFGIFGKKNVSEPDKAEEIDMHDFSFLKDLTPEDAMIWLGVDPNGDPAEIVPKLVSKTEREFSYGLFQIDSGNGEYLIYQSPLKHRVYRFLQNPSKMTNDADITKDFDMRGAAPDKKAWSLGWFTWDYYVDNLLLVNTDEIAGSIDVFTSAEGDGFYPDDVLERTEFVRKYNNFDEYKNELEKRNQIASERKAEFEKRLKTAKKHDEPER